MTIVYWTLVVVLGLTGLLWALNLLQLVARAKDRNAFRVRADSAPDAPTAGPLVSVIIPARNEQGNIGPCLDHVLAQTYQTFEVIVLDDRSDDATRQEAATRQATDDRVRIESGVERPEGWMGKVWACHNAQQKARGDILLFIDADVRLEPEAIRQAAHYLTEKKLGALSVFGMLTMVSFWEWVVQPVVGGLILQNNDPAEVNDPAKPEKVMANGQFIMATRDAYDAVGGHESIRGEILDDVGFARRCKTESVPYHMVYGRELFGCRMYKSLSEIWEGWTKNLFAGLHYNLALALGVCFALLLINIVPFVVLPIAIVWNPSPTDPLVGLAVWNVTAMYIGYFAGLVTANYSPRYFWSYPLGMLVTVGLFANSARRIASGKGVSWKGRTYVTTGRGQKP